MQRRFEAFFSDWLKSKIEKETGISLWTAKEGMWKVDEQFKLAKKAVKANEMVVPMIFKGGNTIKGTVPAVDINSTTVTVFFVVFNDDREMLLNALAAVATRENAVINAWTEPAAVEGQPDETILRFRTIFDTPVVLGASQEIARGNGSEKASTIQWSMSISYSRNAFIEPVVFRLKIGTNIYPVNGVSRYERSKTSSYAAYQAKGDEWQRKIRQSNVFTVALTIIALENDELQELFHQELKGADSFGGTPKLAIDSSTEFISMTEYSLSESYENNAEVYSLTLAK